jgi:hypothetical protein
MELYNFDNQIAYCEAMGLSKCFEAYAKNCSSEEIMLIGFNKNSGNVYIALENGITICSMLGRDVSYICHSNEDEELFFASYEETLSCLQQ